VARFDLYPNPDPEDRIDTPYVLDVQNDHIAGLGTRVVIPLRTLRLVPVPARGLNPVLTVGGKRLVLDTASLAPVPLSMLKRPMELAAGQRGEVLDALDTLFGAY
jgi:toxin CcdB